MTESEDIDATNLAKVRAAKNLLLDTYFHDDEGEIREKAYRLILRLEDALAKRVKVK